MRHRAFIVSEAWAGAYRSPSAPLKLNGDVKLFRLGNARESAFLYRNLAFLTQSPRGGDPFFNMKNVVIYTDGGCDPNPGKGGFGVVLLYGGHRKELSGGFRQTTNNRMEIMAAIVGLEALKRPCSVTVRTDSQYLAAAITKGWAKRWRRQGWMRNKSERAINPDLWERLLILCDRHAVKFEWVRGHDGNAENERCDDLAGQALAKPDLPMDAGYGVTKEIEVHPPDFFGM